MYPSSFSNKQKFQLAYHYSFRRQVQIDSDYYGSVKMTMELIRTIND